MFGSILKKESRKVTENPVVEEIKRHAMDYGLAVREINKIIKEETTSEDIKDSVAEYLEAVKYYVDYMNENYPDDVLETGNAFLVSRDKMLVQASTTARILVTKPSYKELIYIDDTRYSAHMHTDGENITEVENIHILPGLDPLLAKKHINRIFDKLSIEEAYVLLKQMHILPKDSELERCVLTHRIFSEVNTVFLRDVIRALLDTQSVHSLTRARLFAEATKADYKFESLDTDEKIILSKKRNESN